MAGCFISCSVEVRSREIGRQHDGSVSISVGLLWVKNGFMKRWSNPDQYFARSDFSPAIALSCKKLWVLLEIGLGVAGSADDTDVL